jgi:hypothetical protein
VDGRVEVVKLLSVCAAARDIRRGSCVRRDNSGNPDGAEGDRSRLREKGRYCRKRHNVPARVSTLRGRVATALGRTRPPGLANPGACSAGLKLDGADVLVGIFRGCPNGVDGRVRGGKAVEQGHRVCDGRLFDHGGSSNVDMYADGKVECCEPSNARLGRHSVYGDGAGKRDRDEEVSVDATEVTMVFTEVDAVGVDEEVVALMDEVDAVLVDEAAVVLTDADVLAVVALNEGART